MNKEQILEMGRNELNLAIAEKVLGWTAWEEKRGEYTYIVFQKPGEREPYKKTQKWETAMQRYRQIGFDEIDPFNHIVTGVKEWSSDIAAAWEVVEKPEIMDRIQIGVYPTSFGKWVARSFMPGYEITVQADRAPEAICKAALLAVLEQEASE